LTKNSEIPALECKVTGRKHQWHERLTAEIDGCDE
jgi:hypothetical protein